MTELVLPQHANALGTVFGGTIVSWVDIAGAIAAQRHAGATVVTAFIDDLRFEGPIRVGQVARLDARVSATFKTSLEVEVTVLGEESSTGRLWSCVRAILTFVAIGPDGRPTPIPPMALETDDDRARQSAGAERRARRLAARDHGAAK
jgi:acyl-CoA hydrolase